MIYKTIKGVNFFEHIFDVDNCKIYKIINYNDCCKKGFYLITEVNEGMWKVIRQIRCGVMKENEYYNLLPFFTKLSLINFLTSNYANYIHAQNIISKINL